MLVDHAYIKGAYQHTTPYGGEAYMQLLLVLLDDLIENQVALCVLEKRNPRDRSNKTSIWALGSPFLFTSSS